MTRFSFHKLCLSTILLLALSISEAVYGQDGFAAESLGGKGGKTVSVNTAADLTQMLKSEGPLIIKVSGTLAIGSVAVASQKTVIGTGKNPTIVGNLYLRSGVEHVILKNLTFTNPMNSKGKGGGDGVTIRGGKKVWIDHCTFVDCGDGCIDITEGANDVTVSWCKFYYINQPKHRYTMLAVGRAVKKKKKRDIKEVRVTLHHNWWGQGCDSRMPAARKAKVHMYNNYFNCPGNFYCTNARADALILSESNYYQDVQNPIYAESGGRLKTKDNRFDNCTGKAEQRDDEVFDPPYDYVVDNVSKVPEMVRRKAGAH